MGLPEGGLDIPTLLSSGTAVQLVLANGMGAEMEGVPSKQKC